MSSIPASGWAVVEMDANNNEVMSTFAYKIEIQAEHHDPATVVIVHADHDHLDDDEARKQSIIKKTWEEGAGDEFLVEFGEILLTPRPEAFRDQYVMVQQKRDCRTALEKSAEVRKSEAFGPLEEDLERIISDAQFSMDQWNEIEAGLKANSSMWPGVEAELTAGPSCGCNPDFLNSETGCE